MNEQSSYWFPAKRYGWGWGMPNSWQGWLVLVAYTASLLIGAVLIDYRANTTAFVVLALVASLFLTAICWFKGEPPRWRWGR